MGGEGEGEGAHDGGLDPALKVEELTRCHRVAPDAMRRAARATYMERTKSRMAAAPTPPKVSVVTTNGMKSRSRRSQDAACRVFGYLVRRASAVKTWVKMRSAVWTARRPGGRLAPGGLRLPWPSRPRVARGGARRRAGPGGGAWAVGGVC